MAHLGLLFVDRKPYPCQDLFSFLPYPQVFAGSLKKNIIGVTRTDRFEPTMIPPFGPLLVKWMKIQVRKLRGYHIPLR
jgi:hypothetical protein